MVKEISVSPSPTVVLSRITKLGASDKPMLIPAGHFSDHETLSSSNSRFSGISNTLESPISSSIASVDLISGISFQVLVSQSGSGSGAGMTES